MALIKYRYSRTPVESLSTQFHHTCHSLLFHRDHLRSNMGIISGPGSFAVQFGDHLRSGIICGRGVIFGPIQCKPENENCCRNKGREANASPAFASSPELQQVFL